MIFCGVDCGCEGSVAVIDSDSEEVWVEDTQLTPDRTLDGHWLLSLLMEHSPTLAVIEYCFKPLSLVRMLGQFEGVLSLCQVDCEVVAVSKWKKAVFGENHKDKQRSIDLCLQLYPKADLWRPTPAGRKKNLDHNRAEAVLLAHYLKSSRLPQKSGKQSQRSTTIC